MTTGKPQLSNRIARLCSRIPGSLVSPLASLLAMAYLVVLEHKHGETMAMGYTLRRLGARSTC